MAEMFRDHGYGTFALGKWHFATLEDCSPEGTILAPRNPGVEPWDKLHDANKAVYLRMQEAFAGFLDHTADQVGRLIDFLEMIDLLDDTIVMSVSDNSANQETGTSLGTPL